MSRHAYKSLIDVIRHPVVSEKSLAAAEAGGVHVFEVAPSADKLSIRKAVEKMFSVEVADVRVANIRGKTVNSRQTRRVVGRRNMRRKAYVRLAEGHDINYSENA